MLSSRADTLGIMTTKSHTLSVQKKAHYETKNTYKPEELQEYLTGYFSSSFASKVNIQSMGFAKVSTVLQKSF